MARWGEAQAWAQNAARYTGDDCLLWPFSTARGYGKVAIPGVPACSAHRAICYLSHGAPPSRGMDCAHSCGNRLCCNPSHLRWATRADNEADKALHGRDNRGSRHGMSSLTAEDVTAIRRMRRSGVKRVELARKFKIKPATIYDITSGRRWSWLGESQ